MLYDEKPMQDAAALKLPPCTRSIDCTHLTNRVPPPLPWWLPVGAVRVSIRAFKTFFHLGQLGDLKQPISKIVKDADLDLSGRADVRQAWIDTSKTMQSKAMERYAIPRPPQTGYGVPGSGASFGTQSTTPTRMSISEFLEKEPFTIRYLDVGSDIAPSASELQNQGGLAAYVQRGGVLMHIPTLEGQVPLKRVYLYACASWCRGCVTEFWPAGVPTCLLEIKIETEGFDWGIFVQRLPNQENEVTIKRLPKDTWDHIEDGIRALTSKLDTFISWMCDFHRAGGSQAAAASLPASDPGTAAGIVAANAVLDAGCGVSSVAGQTVNYTPGYQLPLVPAPSQLPVKPSTPPSSVPNWQIGLGIGALLLAAAGGAALLKGRGRR